MSRGKINKIKRFLVSELPLLDSIAEQLDLRKILSEYIVSNGNEKIPVVDTLLLLIYNISIGRKPLYELEKWMQSIDTRCLSLNLDNIKTFNDDRFGRALDKLYLSDRASLMTEIVIKMIKAIDLDLSRIHNDSTTVKAFGKISGITKNGLKLAKGKSKDHRPDLKQLVFSLSISSDGAVPVHYKTYSGNRTDDTTHIETWKTIRNIINKTDFLYVADCKVCTSKQLDYIVNKQGRVVTLMPETWKECQTFKDKLRSKKQKKNIIWKKKKIGLFSEYEKFSIYKGNYYSEKSGYCIYWIHSSEKKERDAISREQRMERADKQMFNLLSKLNKRNLKTKKDIELQVDNILKKYKVKRFFKITMLEKENKYRKQIGRGRPGENTKYEMYTEKVYKFFWEMDKKALKQEENVDGTFPLLCTDKTLTAIEALKAYKYQPRLEKRFNQFKSVHEAAPLLFKKIERVESIMFLFFLSLMIQAIIEREIRKKMKTKKIKTLPIYPEFRDSHRPTTSKIFDIFEGVSSYKVTIDGVVKEFKDDLTPLQEKILDLLNINILDYWKKLKYF